MPRSIGTSSRDLRAALEHTLSLNPRMTSGWQHLFWEALWERDTLLSRRVLDELTKLRYDSVSRGESGFDELAHFRYLDALARARRCAARFLARRAGDTALCVDDGSDRSVWFRAAGERSTGFPREQVSFSRRVIARGASPQMVTAHLFAIAVGQAARGSWDSSVVALDAIRHARIRSGAALTAIASRSSVRGSAPSRRTAPRGGVRAPWPTARGSLRRSGRRSPGSMDCLRMRARIRARSPRRGACWPRRDSVTAPMLGRSLAAFAVALAGDRGRAADSLEALEGERVERGWSRYRSDMHPFLTAIDRLAAGRWLRERGDAARAARLLTWHEAVLFPQRETRHANVMVQGLAYLELARATAALGHDDLARDYYQRFLWRYDAPPARRTGTSWTRRGARSSDGDRSRPGREVRLLTSACARDN